MDHLSNETTVGPHAYLDLTYLLYTNTPPDDVEKAVIRREIDMLEPSIQRVRAQLEELKNRLFRCKLALAPIRKVPLEVIGEIFRFTLEAFVDHKARAGDLLRLALVCKTWNDEAHNSAHWSDISISPFNCKPKFPTCREMAARFKDLRTIRFKDFAVCECLRSTEQGVSTCLLNSSACLQLLSCSRDSSLQSISLSVSCFRCFQNLTQSVKAGEEALQAWKSIRSVTLDIRAHRQPRAGMGPEDFDFRDLPPSLTSLTLSFPRLHTTGTQLNLYTPMFRNLSSLDFSCGWNTPFTLDVIRLCKKLRHLRLDYGKSPQTWSVAAAEVVLPNLRTLDVSMTPSASATVLPLFILPALVDVRMGVDHGREVCDNLAHLKVLPPGTPSAPILQSLTIYSSRFAEDDSLRTCGSEQGLVDTFFAIPSLQSFTIRAISFSSRLFLEILQQRVERGDQVFLPNIQSIQLIEPRPHFGSFDVESFLQFVKIRHHLMRSEVDVRLSGQPDSLRRIVFRFTECDSEFSGQTREWGLALDTISLLEKSYGVVVDRVFFPQ
ncbi:hypothetical protein NMY22_g4936 [Coprinellus aureogranulatus]|nr:hypothetical protein NMY22_g4936 [Coprinellus aureogranulatus]